MYRIYVNRDGLDRNRRFGENNPTWVVENLDNGERRRAWAVLLPGPSESHNIDPKEVTDGVTMWLETKKAPVLRCESDTDENWESLRMVYGYGQT